MATCQIQGGLQKSPDTRALRLSPGINTPSQSTRDTSYAPHLRPHNAEQSGSGTRPPPKDPNASKTQTGKPSSAAINTQ
ncbi:hypothetical protein DAKH74_039790 [Maudiozyma humilis]|uniref:Uncharacterized protein n=1 Tax=Maudiozyma humilis TaxID=51915 RepID=A0AAV5S0V6_MAUHU|nr:hypothetical protein DAKH74_039790 [Kazachstania humilis]